MNLRRCSAAVGGGQRRAPFGNGVVAPRVVISRAQPKDGSSGGSGSGGEWSRRDLGALLALAAAGAPLALPQEAAAAVG